MKEAVISVLTNWKNFSGRACRSEFWYFMLASAILGGIVGLVELATGLISIEDLITNIYSFMKTQIRFIVKQPV